MTFHADLHVHSKYSRATSRDLDLEHLAFWAARKGIGVVGAGDCVHPAWLAELKDKLVPVDGGLFRLRPEIEAEIFKTLPPLKPATATRERLSSSRRRESTISTAIDLAASGWSPGKPSTARGCARCAALA